MSNLLTTNLTGDLSLDIGADYRFVVDDLDPSLSLDNVELKSLIWSWNTQFSTSFMTAINVPDRMITLSLNSVATSIFQPGFYQWNLQLIDLNLGTSALIRYGELEACYRGLLTLPSQGLRLL